MLATGLSLALVSAAHADTPCSSATLNGTYGALIKGTASGLPFAALDVVTADGQGNFSGTGTIAVGGAITQNVSLSATYSIDSSCSGTVSFSNGATQTLVITRDGKEVQFIRTDQLNDQVTGDAKRVDAKKCSNKSLQGDLGASLSGDVSGLPFVGLDLVNADGNGTLTGTGTISIGGAITAVTLAADYTINSDCSGSIAFSSGATQDLVVVGAGSEVRFIRTDNPNAVVTGVATNLANH